MSRKGVAPGLTQAPGLARAPGLTRAVVVLALFAGVAAPLEAWRRIARFQPDPSAVAATEIALNRLAQEKGRWAAWRETAAEEATLAVPQRVVARDWLRGRVDTATPTAHDPQTVYVSCDGRLAVATGLFGPEDRPSGRFVSVWRRDAKKGQWQWLFMRETAMARPGAALDYLEGHVAECRAGVPVAEGGRPGGAAEPVPRDESLLWNYDEATGALVVDVWNGQAYDRVIGESAAGDTGPTGKTSTGQTGERR